ncbi:MAG: aminotransferase class I/II-fold pyridoxal phosphate-dependent enzyme [Bacteroidia bacterium]|jgi:methionine aminotransferase|nr:aminotransferase class I/II-fold pyridoxal phosphate-dependent enzyme [Bacteroidota bacterium]MBP6640119.1 aminotransferase class I/II-fold pyridoxal phosphate-dependent enzyme [Bacteroidia bacterium]MBP6723082.1 aminotransferase class I/II-fold pyridoxal phosphate-dependent enzyme [Bacteroidia bacterium]
MIKVAIESKLPSVGTSIFSVMSALANAHGAINLSQGFPDFSMDPRMKSLVTEAMAKGFNQYTAATGLPALREQISALATECYGIEVNPESEVTVTSGGTEALFCAIAATISEGDEVIVFEPCYDSYVPVIELFGGVPIYVPLDFPDYKINWQNVKKRVSSRTRMIILNSPHNPTGSTLDAADLAELAKIVQANPIVILSDEVYEHIIFDGADHQSILRHKDLAKRSFVVSSFGKTFHATGWKVGYCIAPEHLSKEFRKIHQFVTFSTSTPFQWAIAEYMKDRSHILELRNFYQTKRDYFLDLMKQSRFEPLTSKGTYFQLMKYDQISKKGDKAFAEWLTVEKGVATIPVSVFYHSGEDNKVLRFCFAKENSTLEKAAEILIRL